MKLRLSHDTHHLLEGIAAMLNTSYNNVAVQCIYVGLLKEYEVESEPCPSTKEAMQLLLTAKGTKSINDLTLELALKHRCTSEEIATRCIDYATRAFLEPSAITAHLEKERRRLKQFSRNYITK